MVPFQRDMTLSPAERPLKSLVGSPDTGEPDELGAGMANVLVGAPEIPATPEVGSIDSEECPK